MNRGLLITLEGGEGTGKSTLIRGLADSLAKHYHRSVVQTREPGGTPGADEIRALLLSGDHQRWDAVCEALLMFAARRDHWQRLIRPTLEKGDWVLCDRFVDSSFVYQGLVQGLDMDWLVDLYSHTNDGIWPDLTLVLDLDPRIGLKRAISRNNPHEMRFENKGIEFHQKIREGYMTLAQQYPERCIIVDADQTPHQLADCCFGMITKHLQHRLKI